MRFMGRLLPALLVCAAWPGLVRAQAPDLDEILARAMEFVARYESELGTVIADEKVTQEAIAVSRGIGVADAPGRPGSGSTVPRTLRTRELTSEFLLVGLSGGEGQWVGFRNVLRVNGRAVQHPEERFDAALLARSANEAVQQWKRLHAASAGHNISLVGPRINVPTVGLQVLTSEHQPRFNFRVDKERQKVEGVDTVVLEYEEFSTPTLIEDPNGEPVFTSGRVWVSPLDGRVLRTELVTRATLRGRRLGLITVRFEQDARLRAWVPARMDEEYFSPTLTVRCSAKYSNFRRFGGKVEGGNVERGK